MLTNYLIDVIEDKDIEDVTRIYNSNKDFLSNHIGIPAISKEFIYKEIQNMKEIGFKCLVIKDHLRKILGVCDYKIDDEVYLSLLMIDGKLKGKGLGKKIYYQLESKFRQCNAESIRIDVVYNYDNNALDFWRRQGFSIIEEIEIEWNKHKSKAYKMIKNINNKYITRESTDKEAELVIDGLVKHNLKMVPAKQDIPFLWINRVIEGDNGNVIAGILSKMYCWNCLYIDALWVDDNYRGEGLGSKLLLEIEQIAKEKGCYLIHLDTFDFQAKDFYLKYGYEVFGELKDCPKEHSRYFMKKNL